MSRQAYPAYKPSGIEWMGEIPEHWRTTALKRIVSMKSGEQITADGIEDEGPYPVFGGNGIRGYTSHFTHDGWFPLIGRQGALCGNINYATGKFWASEHAVVVSPVLECSVFWIGELLRAMNLGQYSISAAQPGLSVESVGNLHIPYPPLHEQRAIATFLDRETVHIDTLIEKKKRQIELLQEKRSALISHAVTKGLNPKAKMKDSGIEWLGEIPEHWEIKRAKVIFREIDARSRTGQEELLTVSHITGVTPRSEKTVTMFMAESLEGYKMCIPGDLVINTMWAWMGALGITLKSGIVSPSYNVYRFRRNDQEPKYYDYLFHTTKFISEVIRYSQGVWTSRLRLYPEEFYQIQLPCPPLEEQNQIVSYIERETGNYDALQNKIQESISKLHEYRTALISAAVTGKIDVREEASA